MVRNEWLERADWKQVCTPSMTRSILLSTSLTLSPTPFTLSSTLWVALRPCAAVIPTSSCVSRSNRLNASSMSVLPTSFFTYFPKQPCKSIWAIHTISDQLTRSALFQLLCSDRKNTKHLNHDFDYYVCHSRSWWHFHVCLQPSEEVFYSLEDRYECVLTIGNCLSRLGEYGVMISPRMYWMKTKTHREKDTNPSEDDPRWLGYLCDD